MPNKNTLKSGTIKKATYSLYKYRYLLLSLVAALALYLIPAIVSVRAASLVSNPTFTVNSTGDEADNNPGDSVCHTSAGTCTLRAAITEANATSNAIINFNLGASGSLQTITPGLALPDITQPVTIDGTSQPGYTNTPLIELDGSNTSAGVNGLTVLGGSTTIKGLVINRFSGAGIELRNNGNNILTGNYIGTDSNGQIALGNTNSGVWVNEVPNNTIGGTTASARNIISGNFNYGIKVSGNGSTGNRIQGNYLGTDVTGQLSVGNSAGGLCICGGSTTTVGGSSSGARNIISGNSSYGIRIEFTGAVNNVVQGNYIGTNAAGTSALPNTNSGVYITGAGSNTIGGGVTGTGNFISGNTGYGILVSGSDAINNTLQGNYIGLKPSDSSALKNGLNGIMIDNSAANTAIGGSLSGQFNTIAYNGGAGIFVNSGTGQRIQGNSIFSNEGLGIDLAPSGVNPNDAGDADSGPNNLQNFPVLNLVTDNSSTTTIQGVLDSTPSSSFNLAFYTNSSCDASGNGEGQIYLTTQNVATNSSGAATFNVSVPTPDALHRYITITATDTNSQSTSEFSACNIPVTITTQPGDYFITPNTSATLSVAATGTPDLFYQWYQGNTGDTSTPVGTNSASFTTPSLTGTTGYWVRVTNFAGSADSRTATVTSCLYVTQTSDNGAGNCGTLSGAINVANSLNTDVTISFTVGTVTVNGPTPLNTLNGNGNTITLDGGCTVQDNRGTPGVQIIAGSGASSNGLSVGNNVTINGLKITGFAGYALDIQGSGNQVTCDWLGTADGTTASANGGGIQLGTVNGTAANNNSIGLDGQPQSGNIISGNNGNGGLKGIQMNKGTGNQIYNNLIGFDINGVVLRNEGGAINIAQGGNIKFGPGNRVHA